MTRPLFLSILIGVAALFFSCYSTVSKKEHPEITDAAILQARKLTTISPTRSVIYLDSVYSTIKTPGSNDLYKKYDFLGTYNYGANNLVKALKYSDSALAVLAPLQKQPKFNSIYSLKLLDRGDILFKQNLYTEAYFNYYKARTALTSQKSCDNPQFYYGFYSRLANVSYGQSQFTEAIDWHSKAIIALSACGLTIKNAYQIQGTLDNIALCYSFINKPDSALHYYNAALGLTKNALAKQPANYAEFEIAKGVILGNQGTTYYKKENISAAEKNYKESIAINSKPGYANQDALITRVKLAELYLDKNDLKNAQMQLKEVNSSKDTLAEPQDKLQLIMTRSKYAEKTGDIVGTIKLLHNYISLMYAIKKANKQRIASNFGYEFELLNREYAIKAIKKENQVKNIFLLIAMLVVIMGSAIIYLLFRAGERVKLNQKSTIKHNEQLEAALNALENSSIENTRLLSLVAHDLKNPINAIYGITELMISAKGRNNEDLEMLDLIKISSKNMDDIIRDLLSAKINGTALKKEFASVNLWALLSECVSLLQYRAKEKNLKIVLLQAQDINVSINRERIWRVVNNLLVNAIKFSHRDGQIIVGLAINETEAIVTVADSGIGIPKDISDKIFELSGGAKREGTWGEETFGLGLFISKQIIEEHNGRMWFESKESVGTTFYFSLPLS